LVKAEPPTNYNDPYSTLPPKIKLETIKKDVTGSEKFKPNKKDSFDYEAVFKYLINMEHMEALISDAFWYYICEYKDQKALEQNAQSKRQYEQHNEFLLDRMAANYVSYTLVEDPKRLPDEAKRKYFCKFYNYLSQAVYHALKLAFPKDRKEIETPATKRRLLNMFSLLFTGITVHSAKFSNWHDSSGTSQPVMEESDVQVSLADTKKTPGGGPIKSKR